MNTCRAKLDLHEQKFLPQRPPSVSLSLALSLGPCFPFTLQTPNSTSLTTQFKDPSSSRRPSQLLPPSVSSSFPELWNPQRYILRIQSDNVNKMLEHDWHITKAR